MVTDEKVIYHCAICGKEVTGSHACLSKKERAKIKRHRIEFGNQKEFYDPNPDLVKIIEQ